MSFAKSAWNLFVGHGLPEPFQSRINKAFIKSPKWESQKQSSYSSHVTNKGHGRVDWGFLGHFDLFCLDMVQNDDARVVSFEIKQISLGWVSAKRFRATRSLCLWFPQTVLQTAKSLAFLQKIGKSGHIVARTTFTWSYPSEQWQMAQCNTHCFRRELRSRSSFSGLPALQTWQR